MLTSPYVVLANDAIAEVASFVSIFGERRDGVVLVFLKQQVRVLRVFGGVMDRNNKRKFHT